MPLQAVLAGLCLAASLVTVLGANEVPSESLVQAFRGDFSNSNQFLSALPGTFAFLSALGGCLRPILNPLSFSKARTEGLTCFWTLQLHSAQPHKPGCTSNTLRILLCVKQPMAPTARPKKAFSQREQWTLHTQHCVHTWICDTILVCRRA